MLVQPSSFGGLQLTHRQTEKRFIDTYQIEMYRNEVMVFELSVNVIAVSAGYCLNPN